MTDRLFHREETQVPVHIHPSALDSDPRPCEAATPPARSRSRREKERTLPRLPVGPVRHPWYVPIKGALDLGCALILMAICAPFIGVAALLVKLTSRGPAFYTQTRVGQHGRLFTIYKIRTMVDNCESLTGPRWSIPGDPRVTRIGQFLRLSHLDELPQLLNVLRGEMSLIGPRPERPEFLPRLERSLPAYRDRLMVRPGVTGLAQVQLPADTDLASVRRKLDRDLHYIEWLSPWLDLRILCCTALYAAGVPFRITRKLLGASGLEEEETSTALETGIVRPRLAA
jgi:lipopolysaccharide/colanic/teichoic acid biosynthesis glycosyltransferase